MSEYKRFVSYIYAYTKEGKGNNAGFAKVEIRAGKKRLSIMMRGIQGVPVMHVCGFSRNEERLTCVPLGRMLLSGGSGQFQYGMDGEWIPGSRVRFEELAGIVISAPDSSGETYATVWDDEPFQLSMFAKEEEPEENGIGADREPEEHAEKPLTENSIGDENPADSQGKQEEASEKAESPFASEIIQSVQTEEPHPADAEEERISAEHGEEGEILHSAQLEDEEDQEQTGEASEFWKKMCRIYPKITPFSYENHMECLKVKPGDIGRLPRQNWIFGNNSFLLHGYFKYRYLIFGKVQEGDAGGYLIGVPGTYSSNEKFLAGMFGFYDFKPVQKGNAAPGAFGYWCTPMEGPRESSFCCKAPSVVIK